MMLGTVRKEYCCGTSLNPWTFQIYPKENQEKPLVL